MINPNDIKLIATPQSVARYLLGLPEKQLGNELWYKSPFREETKASFIVSDKGFHDFGTSEHYDIFSFVQRLKHCSFQESVNLLASLYGVADRDYESDKLVAWYKKQRAEKEKHKEVINWFYLRVWDEVDKEQKQNFELTRIFRPTSMESEYIDTYKILLDEQVSIEGMEEYLATGCDTLEEKEELTRKAMKGELPTWLMNRLEATMTLWDLNIKLKQKREY